MLPLFIEILRACRAVAPSIYSLCKIMLLVVSFHGQEAHELVRPAQTNAVHMLMGKITSKSIRTTVMTSLRLGMSIKLDSKWQMRNHAVLVADLYRTRFASGARGPDLSYIITLHGPSHVSLAWIRLSSTVAGQSGSSTTSPSLTKPCLS